MGRGKAADPCRPDRCSEYGQYMDYTSARSVNIEPTRHERLKVRMLPILALEKYDKRGTSEIVYYRGSHRTWK